MSKRLFIIPLVLAAACLASGCTLDLDPISSCVSSFAGPEVSGQEAPLADFNATLYAESFTLTQSSAPGSVKLKLKAIGTPTGSLRVTLHADLNGNPDVAQTEYGTLDASTITPGADATYYEFTFTSPAKTLAAGTYWIVLRGNSNFNTSTGVYWMATDVSGAYTAGSSLSSGNNGSTWNPIAKAFLFLLGC